MEEEGQSSAPLLEEKQPQTAGCPGCAVDRRKAANPGIPYGSFIYVWIVTLCTGTMLQHTMCLAPHASIISKLIACLLASFP